MQLKLYEAYLRCIKRGTADAPTGNTISTDTRVCRLSASRLSAGLALDAGLEVEFGGGGVSTVYINAFLVN